MNGERRHGGTDHDGPDRKGDGARWPGKSTLVARHAGGVIQRKDQGEPDPRADEAASGLATRVADFLAPLARGPELAESFRRYKALWRLTGALGRTELEALHPALERVLRARGIENPWLWIAHRFDEFWGNKVVGHLFQHAPVAPIGEGPGDEGGAGSDPDAIITGTGNPELDGRSLRDVTGEVHAIRERWMFAGSALVRAARKDASREARERTRRNSNVTQAVAGYLQKDLDPERWLTVANEMDRAVALLDAASDVNALLAALEVVHQQLGAMKREHEAQGKALAENEGVLKEAYDTTKLVKDKAFALAAKGVALYVRAKGGDRFSAAASAALTVGLASAAGNLGGQALLDGPIDVIEVIGEGVTTLLDGFQEAWSATEAPGLTEDRSPRAIAFKALRGGVEGALGTLKGVDWIALWKMAPEKRNQELEKLAVKLPTSVITGIVTKGLGASLKDGGWITKALTAFAGELLKALSDQLNQAAGQAIEGRPVEEPTLTAVAGAILRALIKTLLSTLTGPFTKAFQTEPLPHSVDASAGERPVSP